MPTLLSLPTSVRLAPRTFLLLLSVLVAVAARHQPPAPVFPLPFPIADTHRDAPHFLDTASIFRQLTDHPLPPIVAFQPTHQLLVKDGDVDQLASFAFQPEPGRNISHYLPSVQCDFPQVLDHSDVHLSPPVIMPDGRANYTALASFQRAVGSADLSIIFHRTDGTVYASVSFQYTVCGISFYHLRGGKQQLLPDNLLQLPFSPPSSSPNHSVHVFSCFIQYPDGSTSRHELSELTHLPSLAEIQTEVTGDPLIPDHSFPTCAQPPHVEQDGQVVLPSTCPFGFVSQTRLTPPYFTVRLLPYRTGTLTFRFTWPGFLASKSSDVFETYLSIVISGTAETSIISIAPNSPFRNAGAQLLRCTLINASPSDSFALQLGGHRLDALSIASIEDRVAVTFVTPKGSGSNVPWDLLKLQPNGRHVSCPWASDVPRFVFSYAKHDLQLQSLSPGFGPVAGGITVSCSGYFADFSIKRGDAFVMGSFRLTEDHVVAVTENSLVFTLPPRSAVDAHSFQVVCHFVVGGLRSNDLIFVYESLTNARIAVSGASYQQSNNTYMIPFCARSLKSIGNASLDLFANVNSGASFESLEFEWHVVTSSTKKEVFKYSGTVEAQSLALPLRSLVAFNTYQALVVIRDKRFKSQVTSSVTLQPTFSRMLGVGLLLDSTRTLVFPPVDSRVAATIADVGQCFGTDKRLTYEWSFLSKKHSLSFSDADVVRDQPSPRRLGREYIIPRRFLRYGEHDVRLKVFQTGNPDAYGTAVGHLRVEPSPLRAVINNGESKIRASSSSDLAMTGKQSTDPDSSSSRVDGLMYLWRCELSTEGGANFMSAVECPSDVVSEGFEKKESFTFSSSRLKVIRNANESIYLRFFLQVKTINSKSNALRASSTVVQVVEIIRSEASVAPVGQIALSGPDGSTIDAAHVPFFDRVVLSPRAPEGTRWRFTLVEPAEDKSTFLHNPANLVQFPGFFQAKSLIASRSNLGIQGGVLKAQTKYVFEVEFETKSFKRSNVVQIALETMPSPEVRFVSLSQTDGTLHTRFFASAVPSVESYSFKFFFYVELSDGSEMCIDGCSGHRNVAFRVPLEGEHVVRCVMVDARGKFVLARAKENYKIRIRATGSLSDKAQDLDTQLTESFQHGDHSSFSLMSISLAAYAKTVKPTAGRESSKVGDLVASTLERLSGLFRKTQPNTQLGKDYMKIAKKFASLPVGHEGLAAEASFYSLSQMISYAVTNTPRTERFDMAEDLNATLNNLRGHARQLVSSGSSRERSLEKVDEEGSDVNEKVLELSELVVPLWTRVRGRDAVCGETRAEEVGGMARVSIGMFCSKEHGKSLDGEFSGLRWCDAVYGKNGIRRTRIALGEYHRDYIAESGVLRRRRGGGKVASVRNGAVNIDTEDMASHGVGIVRTMIGMEVEEEAEEAEEAEEDDVGDVTDTKAVNKVRRDCIELRQRVRATNKIFGSSGGGVVCDSARGVRYLRAKEVNKTLARTAYTEEAVETEKVNETDVARRQRGLWVTSVIGGSDGRDGRFGVKRTGCRRVQASTLGIVYGVWIPIVVTLGVFVITAALMLGGMRVLQATAIYATAEDENVTYIERDTDARHAHHFADDAAAGGAAALGAAGEEVVLDRRGGVGGGIGGGGGGNAGS